MLTPQPLENIENLLTRLIEAPWRGADVPHYLRARFHGYLRLEEYDETQTPIWVYRVFDFTGSSPPGQLDAVVQYPGIKKNSISTYHYCGFVAANKTMILVGTNLREPERPVIQVLPADVHGRPMSGLAFFHNALGHDLVAPSMMSADELIEHLPVGPVRDVKAIAELDKIWERSRKPWQLWVPQSEGAPPRATGIPTLERDGRRSAAPPEGNTGEQG